MSASSAEAEAERSGGKPAPKRAPAQWIIEHDDRWLWTILYIGSAVVLSIFISEEHPAEQWS